MRTLILALALSLCLPIAADDIASSNPEWAALMVEARRLWYVGDFAAGNELLLRATEVAGRSSEPLTLARSLDMAARAIGDDSVKMDLLKAALEIKERARGLRYVGLADTLLSMGSAAGGLAYKKNDDGTDPDPSTYLPAGRPFYFRARDILLEAYGEGCEVGRADAMIASTYLRIDPSKAEKAYREILVHCPVDPADSQWEKPSITARIQLDEILRMQGREVEADHLPELPEFIGLDYGEPSPGYVMPPDVFYSPVEDEGGGSD